MKNNEHSESSESGEHTVIVMKLTEPFRHLTKREIQVAHYLALGSTTREIARMLEISIKTIDTHRAAVLKKVGVRNAVELARLAIRTGWVTA